MKEHERMRRIITAFGFLISYAVSISAFRDAVALQYLLCDRSMACSTALGLISLPKNVYMIRMAVYRLG
jgi:hypothetical protein